MALGEVAGNIKGVNVTTRHDIDHDTHEFNSIFDILNASFVDYGITNQNKDDIQYSIQKTDRGIIAGGIKIIGFSNEINIDNQTYIPDNNSTIVKYDIVSSSSPNW